MLQRDFYSYPNFLTAVGADNESLRQALIRGEIAAYLEPRGEIARLMTGSGASRYRQSDGENEHCSWCSVTTGVFERSRFAHYKLTGWFRVASASLIEAARVGSFHSPPEVMPVDFYADLDDDCVYEFSYEVDKEGSISDCIDSSYHPPLTALWFHANEVERLTATPAISAKPLDERERGSLLRIIRALDVMAKLPERGAASSVERQLQGMGFAKPSEATIRKVIDHARAMEPDEKGQ